MKEKEEGRLLVQLSANDFRQILRDEVVDIVKDSIQILIEQDKSNEGMTRYHPIDEVSEITNLKPQILYKAKREGHLQSCSPVGSRQLRFTKEAIEAFMKNRKILTKQELKDEVNNEINESLHQEHLKQIRKGNL